MDHKTDTRKKKLVHALARKGASIGKISSQTKLNRGTVREWINAMFPQCAFCLGPITRPNINSGRKTLFCGSICVAGYARTKAQYQKCKLCGKTRKELRERSTWIYFGKGMCPSCRKLFVDNGSSRGLTKAHQALIELRRIISEKTNKKHR